MAELIVKLKDRELQRVLIEGVLTRIGRDRANEVCIDNTGVSRLHCSIKFEEERFVVYDEGSSNGLYVNGDEVLAHQLDDGDEIQLSKFVVGFAADRPATAEDLADISDTAQIRMRGLRKHNPVETTHIPIDEMGRLLASNAGRGTESPTRKHPAVTSLVADGPLAPAAPPAVTQEQAQGSMVLILTMAVVALSAVVAYLLLTR